MGRRESEKEAGEEGTGSVCSNEIQEMGAGVVQSVRMYWDMDLSDRLCWNKEGIHLQLNT